MNVMDAAHATVRAYPGGAESLAPRVGMTPGVLRNKVNPRSDTHRLAIDEASLIVGVTNDYRILHAFNGEHGFVAQRASGECDAGPLLDAVLSIPASQGRFAAAIHDALMDGVITPNEMNVIASAGFGLQDAVILLLAKLRAETHRVRA